MGQCEAQRKEKNEKKSTREFDDSMILRNNGLWEARIKGRLGSSQRGGCLAAVSTPRPSAAGQASSYKCTCF